MAQFHPIQHGTFLVTTNAKNKEPWCVFKNNPHILIGNLFLTRNLLDSKIFAFCILPDHMHIILEPGVRGLSAFMKSFKENSSRGIRRYMKEGIDYYDNPFASADAAVGASQFGINLFHGWQHGFDSRGIGTDTGMENAIRYVESNAARHHLVRSAHDWPWTSLHFPHLLKPS